MQYTPFASDIELPFYTALASLKINHDKLDDSARKIMGLYEIRSTDPPSSSCAESSTLVEAVNTWNYGIDARQRGFFLARRTLATSGKAYQDPTKDIGSELGKEKAADVEGVCWRIATLSDYENGFFDGANFEDCYVCFVDPSNYENAPGWMLRNLLVLVKHRWKLSKIQVLRFRDVHSKRDQGRSIVVTLAEKNQQTPVLKAPDNLMPKVTGWERNPTGKLTGRLVDLTEYLDPQR
ncbi:hypothetical protein APSETT444_004562 [Aspergillus pseudonomiae]